jgi:hypothetical protein
VINTCIILAWREQQSRYVETVLEEGDVLFIPRTWCGFFQPSKTNLFFIDLDSELFHFIT